MIPFWLFQAPHQSSQGFPFWLFQTPPQPPQGFPFWLFQTPPQPPQGFPFWLFQTPPQPPPVPINGFFDNLNEIFQPNMSFEKLAEIFSPKIDKIFENCQQKNENSYVVILKIYKVSQTGKKFYLRFTISDETSQSRTWVQDSPRRSGRYWLDSASWTKLQQEQEKILIEKILRS